jgi:3-phenylpropionate/trans-cinnamate dioxygenase ferredoxin reductase component
MTQTHVIVGGGLAGGTAAMALRANGFDGRIVVIGDEQHLPYSRPPLSKQFVRGEFGLDRVLLRPAALWDKRQIDFVLGRRCVAVDVASQKVTLSDGDSLRYNALLLATGGRARVLANHQLDPAVNVLRTIDDAVAIGDQLGTGKRLLIIGAGFVGAELAASAVQLGTDVTVLEAADVPLGRGLPAELGQVYWRIHREHGVDIQVNATVSGVVREGQTLRTTLTDGRVFDSDAVVVAIGLEPDVTLARQAGLRVDDGILVDQFCRTSAPNVYAAGDIANHPNLLLGQRVRVEHWQNAQHQSQVAAANMIADAEADMKPFAEVPWVWSDQYEINLQVAGRPRPTDEVVFRGDRDSTEFSAMLLRDGVLVAAVGLNRADDIRAVRELIARRLRPERTVLADVNADLTTVVSDIAPSRVAHQ